MKVATAIANVLLAPFQCRHPEEKRGWPITREGETYRRCNECGKAIPHDVLTRVLNRKVAA